MVDSSFLIAERRNSAPPSGRRAEAIRAATRVGAELLGWEDRIGIVEAGKLADLVAVPGDPLADLRLLASPSFVMVGGNRVPLEPTQP